MSEPRTPQEVFQHHGQVLGAGDIDGIVSDYSEDAIFISPDGILRGKDGIRQAFVKLVGDVPNAQWELKTVFADDILFLEWAAVSAHTRRCATRCSAKTESEYQFCGDAELTGDLCHAPSSARALPTEGGTAVPAD